MDDVPDFIRDRQYFDSTMLNRQLLLWAIATRQQLERWEPLVAANVAAMFRGSQLESALLWKAAYEHHFLLIAARNLLRAVDLAEGVEKELAIDSEFRSELIEGRDLHEHWVENMPIFNMTPRFEEPQYRTGRSFAARNPDEGPYFWLGWDSEDGPLILPNVAGHSVHGLIDGVEALVLTSNPGLSNYVPQRALPPWRGEEHGDHRWWPRV